MKPLFLACLCFALCACASSDTLTKPGREVQIVTSMPPKDGHALNDLGEVVVEESWSYDGDENEARDELRNYAARDGADFVLLQEQGRQPCETNSQKSCIYIKGRKLQRADAGDHPGEAL